MPLQVKSISISISVACLFVLSFVGWFAGLEPFTCCKRAMMGAVITYIGTSIVINVINDILISALVESQMEQQQGEVDGRGH